MSDHARQVRMRIFDLDVEDVDRGVVIDPSL